MSDVLDHLIESAKPKFEIDASPTRLLDAGCGAGTLDDTTNQFLTVLREGGIDPLELEHDDDLGRDDLGFEWEEAPSGLSVPRGPAIKKPGLKGGSEVARIARLMRRQGLHVHTVKGWRERGIPSTYTPIGGMFHHTASNKDSGNAPALGTVTYGRPDLTGPLCQFLFARNAHVYVVAAGYANHAGLGGPWGRIPLNSGNRYLVGFECENNGIGEPWSDDLKDAIALGAAIALHLLGSGIYYFPGHKDYAPDRKIDPHPIPTQRFRQERVRPQLRKLKKKAA